MAMICSVGMFAETVTISEDCFKNLPEETQKYVRENAVVSDDDSSIGTEIGIAVNETFKAISDNTIKLAESNLGKSAILENPVQGHNWTYSRILPINHSCCNYG